MIDIKHKRNGQYITNPLNWEELEIVNDFTEKGNDVFDVGIKELVFAGEEAVKIIERARNGLSGGVGIFEGDKYEIELSDGLNAEMYLNYAKGLKISGCNEVTVQVKKKQGVSWLNSVADSFTFRSLEDEGIITSSDFVKVPYVINYIPDGVQLMILSLSLFMMSKELAEAVKATAEQASEIVNASTPVVGTSVGAGAGVVTAWDFGDYAQASLKLVAYIAYTLAIAVAVKNLIDQISKQILEERRFHKGMRVKTLFAKGCQKLGLILSSSIMDRIQNWVIIPAKDHKGGQKPTGASSDWKETGVPGNDSQFDTFGDLLRVFLQVFNADYKIKDGIFHFERRDYWQGQSSFIIDDYYNNQDKSIDEYEFNTDDLKSNYTISYAIDSQDQNTLDNQEGRVFQVITEPKTTTNEEYVDISGLEEIQIPCSLGKAKKSLTPVEEAFKGLGQVVDSLTSVFGSGTSYASDVQNRVGSLSLSSHFLSVPKLVVMQGSKLASNQRELLNAEKFWDLYHNINSFVEHDGRHNQNLIFKDQPTRFNDEDYLSLLNNNFCKTASGKKAEITRLRWRRSKNLAYVDYKVNEKYTDNLKERIL